MITYNPKDWWNLIFAFNKVDIFRKLLPILSLVCLLTAVTAYLEIEVLHMSESSKVSNLTIMNSMLSFVISMLLVFRTNTAYDRWWEGRKAWGSLVNCSANLAIKLSGILPPGDTANRSFFSKGIALYAATLAKHLKSEKTRLALDQFDHPELETIDRNKHEPNQVAAVLFKRINRLYEAQKIKGDQLIILNNEFQTLSDVCGICERIKNTPIPLSYSAFLKRFIFIFVATLPFSFALSLGYLAVPVVGFIFYVLVSLELIAEEIEDPFGYSENDLPIEKIADNISNRVYELLN
jgi:putative membrane protein